MKKIILIIMIVCWMSAIFATKIILQTGETIEGKIVGKVGKILYVKVEDNIKSFTKDDIKEIPWLWGDDKDMRFSEEDWLDRAYQSTINDKLKFSLLDTFDWSDVTFSDVNKMTEREFQLYQLKLNQVNLNKQMQKTNEIIIFSTAVTTAAIIATGILLYNQKYGYKDRVVLINP